MKCSQALDRMLEADPEELLAGTGSSLADHLGTCARCSGIARRIVEGERALGADLISATSAPDLDLLLVQSGVMQTPTDSVQSKDEGQAPLQTDHVASLRVDDRDPSRIGRGLGSARWQNNWAKLRWGRAVLPLAAAAAALTLLLPATRPLPGDPYSPPNQLVGLDLQVPEGRSAAVLETADPAITVLWFF